MRAVALNAAALPRGVQITPNRTLQIAFTWRGRHYRERLRLSPDDRNIAFAARKREAVLYDIERGSFDFDKHFPDSPRARETGGANAPTVEEALRSYLRHRRKFLAESSLRDYRSAVYAHLIPVFGKRRLSELTVAEIRDWVAQVGISTQRIQKVLVPLRAIFADALHDEQIDRDPLARIRLPSGDGSTGLGPDPLTPHEVRRMLAHCDPMFRNYVACAVGSGLRTSELLGLSWADIDFSDGVINVRRALVNGQMKSPKTSAGHRRVRLMPLTINALQMQRALLGQHANGAVWQNPATGEQFVSSQQIRRAWHRVCRCANVRYRRPYVTRHTYASWMLTAGEDPSWIAGQLGHTDWGMIRRTYARWIPSARPEAGRRAASLFHVGPSVDRPPTGAQTQRPNDRMAGRFAPRPSARSRPTRTHSVEMTLGGS